MANIQISEMAKAIKPMLDERAKIDADFAKDYERKDKSIEEFAQLFYDVCSKGRNGGHAIFGSDDVLVAQAVHYYHEDKVTADDISIGDVAIIKSETPKKTEAPKAPAPKADDLDLDFDEDDAPAPKTKKVARPQKAKPVGIEDDFDLD